MVYLAREREKSLVVSHQDFLIYHKSVVAVPYSPRLIAEFNKSFLLSVWGFVFFKCALAYLINPIGKPHRTLRLTGWQCHSGSACVFLWRGATVLCRENGGTGRSKWEEPGTVKCCIKELLGSCWQNFAVGKLWVVSDSCCFRELCAVMKLGGERIAVKDGREKSSVSNRSPPLPTPR